MASGKSSRRRRPHESWVRRGAGPVAAGGRGLGRGGAAILVALAKDAEIAFTHGAPEELVELLSAGELDAALLPPLVAWSVEGTRFVPGIGLTTTQIDTRHDTPLGEWTSDLPRVLLYGPADSAHPIRKIRRHVAFAIRETAPMHEALRHTLGGDESDALRLQLSLAKTRGLIAEAQDLFYC